MDTFCTSKKGISNSVRIFMPGSTKGRAPVEDKTQYLCRPFTKTCSTNDDFIFKSEKRPHADSTVTQVKVKVEKIGTNKDVTTEKSVLSTNIKQSTTILKNDIKHDDEHNGHTKLRCELCKRAWYNNMQDLIIHTNTCIKPEPKDNRFSKTATEPDKIANSGGVTCNKPSLTSYKDSPNVRVNTDLTANNDPIVKTPSPKQATSSVKHNTRSERRVGSSRRRGNSYRKWTRCTKCGKSMVVNLPEYSSHWMNCEPQIANRMMMCQHCKRVWSSSKCNLICHIRRCCRGKNTSYVDTMISNLSKQSLISENDSKAKLESIENVKEERVQKEDKGDVVKSRVMECECCKRAYFTDKENLEVHYEKCVKTFVGQKPVQSGEIVLSTNVKKR